MDGIATEARTGARAEGRLARRAAAVLEVMVVFLGGTLLARPLIAALGLDGGGDALAENAAGADLVPAAGMLAGALLVRYGVILLLAWGIGRWHRGRTVRAWGVTRGGHTAGWLVGAGLLLFAVGGLVPKLLFFLATDAGLGGGPAGWALLDRRWDAGFWIYMAAGSFLLVPIVEELLFRGYVQGRLAEDFGAGAAVWITAAAFTVSHTQYFGARPMLAALLLALFAGALLLGWMRLATGSLLPPVIAHALGNVPTAGVWSVAALVGMAALVIAFRRPVLRSARGMTDVLRAPGTARASAFAIAVVLAVLALVLVLPAALPALLAAAAAAVLVLEARDRRPA